jgi:outer membrane protein OmpA-like peptidoglycan-associated protein
VDTLHVVDTVTFRQTDTLRLHEVRTQVDTNVILVLQDVNFGFGRAALRPAAVPVLQRLAQQLNAPALAGVPIDIRGYTDSIGSDSANYILGLARAAAVRAELIRDGVDPTRLSVSSGGKSDPVDSNATPDGRARNRRVVIRRRTSP